jgi:hypothetical protein
MTCVLLRLHTAIGAGATLKINSEAAYPIYTATGEAITAGAAAGSVLFLVLDLANSKFYLVGGIGSGTGGTNIVSSDLIDKIKIEADNTLSINTVSGERIEGTVPDGTSGKLILGTSGKNFNGAADITLTAADIGALTSASLNNYVQKTVFATDSTGGAVKSSNLKDYISVDQYGLMHINTISGSKIEGGVSKVANALKVTGDVDITYDGSSAQSLVVKNKSYQISPLANVPTDTDRLWFDENGGGHYFDVTAGVWKPITPLWR